MIRLSREMPRYLVGVAALAGIAACARFTLDPPRAAPMRAIAPTSAPVDLAAEGYAVLFARHYLSWNGAGAQQVAPGDPATTAFVAPAAGEQRVEWAEVVQARERARGEHVYTVATQTDSAGLVYLSVGVARTPAGALALSGYPSFVGAPQAAPAALAQRGREVSDPALVTVTTRALRNYLAGSAGELAADLTAGARVSLPTLGLTLEAVQRLDWAPDGRSVRAVLEAQEGAVPGTRSATNSTWPVTKGAGRSRPSRWTRTHRNPDGEETR